ncbi:hypothetical protein TcasGA2_TC000604 [Tribolium castaneum]|uniref:Uncharacterized protein n=1 Tax=Tribolium castaneum TaxID=7070 RepID=A0A139WN01_TRICA|nr:hypothetical protein TcasGA2_TC000604 [Tribolium castaneum]
MRTQKVSVDVWKMVFSSCSYLGLACAAWVLIKLVCACFWLPKYLQNEDLKEKEEQDKEAKPGKEALEAEPLLVQDKKND